jgi:hypothetical protein
VSWKQIAEKLNRHMLQYQKIHCKNPAVEGAIPGSWPIGGGYDSLNFPNHAAKFYVDALSGSEGTRAGVPA